MPRSSPHLHVVHDETKSLGSTPLPHPLDAAAKKAIDCTWWGEGIDPKHFVSLLYIAVAVKASLLKFSMFSIHKNTISNIFLEFSNFKIVGLVQIGILNLLQ